MRNPAQALNEIGLLAAYYTTVGFTADSLLTRAAALIDRATRSKLQAQLGRRAIEGIPADLVHTFPWWEIPRTFLSRAGLGNRLREAMLSESLKHFDRHVAGRTGSYPAVYAFNGSALATFEAAQQKGKFRIYGVRGLHPRILTEESEYRRHPGLARFRPAQSAAISELRAAERDAEWQHANLVIVNSELTRDSHAECGLDVSKARVIPLGFPEVADDSHASRAPATDGALNVLWAGNFSVLKGAHYFLQALEEVSSSVNLRVRVFGMQQLPAELLSGTKRVMVFHSTVPRRQLFLEYRSADILVLPTLSDGFAMVIAEAMSQGLPVITTTRAGASEFIQPGRNGLLIPPHDAGALARTLEWCALNREALKTMGAEARRTARQWQWQDYRREVARVVREAIGVDAAHS